MTTTLLLQILVPAAISFLAGHFHLILPNPKAGSSPFPTSIGHGEIIAWLLTQLASQQPTPPATPQAPSNTSALLAEVLTALKQVLQAQAQQPAQPSQPAKPG